MVTPDVEYQAVKNIWILMLLTMVGCAGEQRPSTTHKPPQGQSPQLDLGSQELKLVYAKWNRSSNALQVFDDHGYLSMEEIELLRKQGVTGELKPSGFSTLGEGAKKARIVLVMFKNIKNPTELLQPDGANAVYLQGDSGFTLLPANTPTISKSLRLEPYRDPTSGKPTTMWGIDIGVGIRGGTAFIWEEDSE